jgi:N-methylhydantoinase A
VRDDEARELLGELADAVLGDLADDGVGPGDVVLHAFARISHEGQRYQLQVPLTNGDAWTPGAKFSGTLGSAAEAFRQRHVATYGYSRSEPLDLFSLDVVAVARMSSAGSPTLPVADDGSTRDAERRRTVWFTTGECEATIHSRRNLRPGVEIVGPAVVEQADTTTLVPPGWGGQSDTSGNLMLRRRTA